MMAFTEQYLDYAALTAQLQAWADAHPSLVALRSIGSTPEGREIWLLIVGPEPDRARPTVWVDGNMHASELAGSSVALAICAAMIEVNLGRSTLPDALQQRLREVRLFCVPRISPDGAETVLRTGQYVRSIPRDRRPDRQRPRWVSADVDGDGLSLVMRKVDPGGEFVASTEVPGLMVLRSPDDAGPFYRVWPEGWIEHFDGDHVPDPNFLGDNDTDLNRQFPYDWRPEPTQVGAGRFPGSEPESRAVIAFACDHPEIFAWLNLHTFGGCFIRPPGEVPDIQLDPSDLALYRELGAWTESIVGYPTVSGYEEFVYEPETPTYGDLNTFAYRQRGAIALTCEIWDLFRQAGIPKKRRFVDEYTQLDRADMEAIGRWDRDHNQSRIVRPWRAYKHAQLGDVEVGGLDIRVGITNPPPELLPDICDRIARFWCRVAALAPALSVRTRRDGDHLTVTVTNEGYLPTSALASAVALAHVESPWVEIDGEVIGPSRFSLGHLDGWGRGRHDGTGALYFLRSRGTTNQRTIHAVVRGDVRVRVGSCRLGWQEITAPNPD
jgi:hypothetical protein